MSSTPFSYQNLPELFYHSTPLDLGASLSPMWLNQRLLKALKIDDLAMFIQAHQSHALALAYGGHQFGSFSLLGDGRAALIAEVHHQGALYDVHLKGSGPTVYARGGDGKAPLKAALKEALIAEALHGLQIPSAHSLGVFNTHETVQRRSVEPAGLHVRFARSHLRIGSLQFAYVHQQVPTFFRYVLERLAPDLIDASTPALAFLRRVIHQQANLLAQWHAVGFIHGVLNTDNIALSGESIDFGPAAFMEVYQPNACYSSIDFNRRYSYQNQAPILLENLTHLAQTLLSEIDVDPDRAIDLARAELAEFMPRFDAQRSQALCRKLGLDTPNEAAMDWLDRLLSFMQVNQFDYHLTFAHLMNPSIRYEKTTHELYQRHREHLFELLRAQGHDLKTLQHAAQAHNPLVVARPQKIQKLIDAAVDDQDTQALLDFFEALQAPCDARWIDHPFSLAETFNPHFETTCGT
jgi:uncharacterized protein YdiU (UPF0061 family)